MKISLPQWLSVAVMLPLMTAAIDPINAAHAHSSHHAHAVSSKPSKSPSIDVKNKLARTTRSRRQIIKIRRSKDIKKIRHRKKHLRSRFRTHASKNSGRTYLRLISSRYRRTNRLGNPIYRLEAYVNGKKYRTFKAVTGTAYSQNRNRHRANSLAPLPNGSYRVSRRIIRGTVTEVGKTFVPIYPRFKTARTDLGVHLDPSYNRRNGSDGTAGCIGLTSASDRDTFNKYVQKFRPHTLIVNIKK
jgi:hypothetical protein